MNTKVIHTHNTTYVLMVDGEPLDGYIENFPQGWVAVVDYIRSGPVTYYPTRAEAVTALIAAQ